MTTTDGLHSDGRIPDLDRLADRAAIQDLATAYAYAVDDRDWTRWEALFLPDALVDYTSAGGIAGTPAEVAAWMPGAMAIFAFCLHTTSTHEIRFTGPDRAEGRVHVFNRNGVEWEDRPSSSMTAIGTLVERHSRYVVLLKLPHGHGAEAVRRAMTKRILTLPASSGGPSPGTRARRWPSTSSSPSTPGCRSTSAIRRARGSC